jgi:hypothetical protein
MPITSFTIDGDEVDPKVENFEIRENEGGISTMTCDVESYGSPVLRFLPHAEVNVEEDGEIIFAGILMQTRERGFGGPNVYDADSGEAQIVTTITAEDFGRLAERVYLTETVAEGMLLEDFLNVLVTYLWPFGVTLHASQVTGPALPAMVFDRVLVSEVLQKTAAATGFVWRIDYDKKLRMWEPGDLAAPFDIDEYDDPPRWTGDVEVERILGDNYANRVIVMSGLIEETNHVETFTGDGVSYSFPLEWTLTGIKDYRVFVDGVPELLTYQGIGFDLAVQWLYYAVDNTIRRETTGVPDPPANGAVISITFDGTFEAEATAEDAAAIAANGLYEHVETRDDIRTEAAAQTIADAILAERLLAGDQTVGYQTRYTAPTLRAGQAQALTATARDLSGSYIITEMRVQAETPATAEYAADGLGLIRTLRLKRNQVVQGKWQHTYRDWLEKGKGRSAATTTVGAGAPAAVGPAAPNRSVQFNNAGAFGGKASFIFYKDEESLVMGDASGITADDFNHCYVFGPNGTITNP